MKELQRSARSFPPPTNCHPLPPLLALKINLRQWSFLFLPVFYPACIQPVPLYDLSNLLLSDVEFFIIAFSDQVVKHKKATAKEVLSQLQQVVPRLPGSTVLDIGFGLGYNTAALKDLGATVFGIEPDTAAYKWAHSKAISTSLGHSVELYRTCPKVLLARSM